MSPAPKSTAFTYQGRLDLNGAPAHGSYGMQCDLFDDLAAGNLIGRALVANPVAVSNGLFRVGLDFGAASFNGEARWLQLSVRSNGLRGDVSFTAEGPFTYPLESKDALRTGVPWALVPGSARTGTGGILTVPDTRPRSPTNRFYRAVMTP